MIKETSEVPSGNSLVPNCILENQIRGFAEASRQKDSESSRRGTRRLLLSFRRIFEGRKHTNRVYTALFSEIFSSCSGSLNHERFSGALQPT